MEVEMPQLIGLWPIQQDLTNIKNIKIMDEIFQACVDLLRVLATYFDTTYEAINVWIFVFIYPVVLGVSILANYSLVRALIKQRKKLN